MGSVSELSLDYKPNTTYPLAIQKASAGDQAVAEQTQKNIEDFLVRLEEERQKIEAFKRELPLCMQLLNSAMETYRQQLGTYQKNHLGVGVARSPVMEEFIPLSNMSISGAEKTPTVPSEKASWMVSAQLWSPALSEPAKPQPTKESTECSLDDIGPKLALDSKQRNGGAFLPFSKDKMSNKLVSSGSASRGGLPELALANSSEKLEMEENKCSDMESGEIGGRREINGSSKIELVQGKGGGSSKSAAAAAMEGQLGAQGTHRKARRCWSPDLHRRFVNALQMLGGSQVATPKQIRELMKVDGLTNDEVKSHLQKYRLHTRRPIPQPQPTTSAAPQLVVLGGIWVQPEYATSAAAAAGPTIYGAHQQAHYDFYASAVPPPHHHHLHLHRGPVAGSAVPYKVTIHSPEPELRSGGGDLSESIQEEEVDDDREGHGRDDEEEEEEEVNDQEDIQKEQDNGSENGKALVPVVDENNINGCSDVALKF